MVIIDKITFKEIKEGEVFQIENGDYFLKCYEVSGEYGPEYNCVNLGTGMIDYCEPNLRCSSVKAKLVIE